MANTDCYRIPAGVRFERWAGEGEWVIYQSGTGETLRISEAAMAIIDLLLGLGPPLDDASLDQALVGMMDDPPAAEELQILRQELLQLLLSHECIERVACD